MQLADFIDENAEEISQSAAEFASTLLPAGAHQDGQALLDHLPSILQGISRDLRTTQTAQQAIEKSRGHVAHAVGTPDTAAQTHARLRAKGGFQIEQLIAEYRALRASVLRLWTAARDPLDGKAVADMVRFNEAIDQAVNESVARFTAEIDRWRQVFLAVLGHDLRNPLNTIVITSQTLSLLAVDTSAAQHVQRLMLSGKRMSALLDDLLDFSRTSLGLGVSIWRETVDLSEACSEEIDLLRPTLPGRRIDWTAEGDARGSFDGSRIRQSLGNLVINAAKYGAPTSAIRILLVATDDSVVLSVENDGAAIPHDELSMLFDPLRRGADREPDAAPTSSLGLGLFIVREIARAHGGDVTATSADGKTRFMISLPRFVDAGSSVA